MQLKHSKRKTNHEKISHPSRAKAAWQYGIMTMLPRLSSKEELLWSVVRGVVKN